MGSWNKEAKMTINKKILVELPPEALEIWKKVLPSIESLLKLAENEPINVQYNSGKINGGKYYHAGSSGDAYLKGRGSALKYFQYLVEEIHNNIEHQKLSTPTTVDNEHKRE
jgi:hypothetical protein